LWRKAASTRNDSQYVLKRMREIQRARPGDRVRARDSKGRLLDILP
jgi:hypothetical protein